MKASLARTEGKPLAPWRPAATEWDLLAVLLAGIFNRLGQLNTIAGDLPAAVKKRTKPPQPFPTPATALNTLQREQDVAHHAAIESAVEEAQARWLAAQEEVTLDDQ